MLDFKKAIPSVYIFISEKEIYYVKLEIDGMYISGITVRKSLKNPSEWWVQMPTYSSGGKYGKYIEFDKQCPFRQVIEDKCIEAVEQYSDPSEIDPSTNIDLDTIDFG